VNPQPLKRYETAPNELTGFNKCQHPGLEAVPSEYGVGQNWLVLGGDRYEPDMQDQLQG
jgi:hypothetical protein